MWFFFQQNSYAFRFPVLLQCSRLPNASYFRKKSSIEDSIVFWDDTSIQILVVFFSIHSTNSDFCKFQSGTIFLPLRSKKPLWQFKQQVHWHRHNSIVYPCLFVLNHFLTQTIAFCLICCSQTWMLWSCALWQIGPTSPFFCSSQLHWGVLNSWVWVPRKVWDLSLSWVIEFEFWVQLFVCENSCSLRSKYRSVPVNPNMDNPNCQIIRGTIEIALLSPQC